MSTKTSNFLMFDQTLQNTPILALISVAEIMFSSAERDALPFATNIFPTLFE